MLGLTAVNATATYTTGSSVEVYSASNKRFEPATVILDCDCDMKTLDSTWAYYTYFQTSGMKEEIAEFPNHIYVHKESERNKMDFHIISKSHVKLAGTCAPLRRLKNRILQKAEMLLCPGNFVKGDIVYFKKRYENTHYATSMHSMKGLNNGTHNNNITALMIGTKGQVKESDPNASGKLIVTFDVVGDFSVYPELISRTPVPVEKKMPTLFPGPKSQDQPLSLSDGDKVEAMYKKKWLPATFRGLDPKGRDTHVGVAFDVDQIGRKGKEYVFGVARHKIRRVNQPASSGAKLGADLHPACTWYLENKE